MIFSNIKTTVIELIGSFIWVFLISLSLQEFNLNENNIFSHSISMSFIISALTLGTINFSETQFNPAITLSLLLTKKINKIKFLYCIVFQILGALIAILTLYFTNFYISDKETNYLLCPMVKDNNLLKSSLLGFITSFLYLIIYYGTIYDKRSNISFVGFTTLLSLLLITLSTGYVFTNSFNILNYLGTIFFKFNLNEMLPLLISPLCGSILGSFTYEKLFLFDQPKKSEK